MTNLKYKSVACFFWGGQMYGFHPALKRLCNQRLFVTLLCGRDLKRKLDVV